MKPTLPPFISALLILFAWTTGDVKANPEYTSVIESTECSSAPDDLLIPTSDNYCYPPDWHYTYDITQTSATFEWEAVYGASYYTVQWRYPNGTWNNVQGYCYQTWITLNNFQSCTSYEWRVKSHCGYGYGSSWCYSVYFTTLCDYCHPPDWLSCYNITGYSATWKWASCYGADSYWVQWRYQGGSWNDLYGCPFYGTWVNVNHLQPCTTYEWRVKSHCYSGWSNWCYPYTFTTLCNYCPAPYGLYTKDIGDNKATFKWSPVYGANSYSVQIRDHYGNWYDVPGSPTSGTWITAYNLIPCHSYEWRVRANCHYNYDSFGYWSAAQPFTTTCGHGCNAPQWVYTSGITNSSAALHWEPVNGADYYVVEWRSAGGIWYELQGGPFTNAWANLTGLQPKTTYEWRVKGHCHDGNFTYWSSVTYFTTLGEECGMPFFRYTLPITDSTATFNWTAVAGALNYSVQFRLINGLWVDVPGSPTTASSISVSGLLPDTLYEWRMKVNCSNGASTNWLSSINFHTGNTSGCNKPASLYVDSLTLTSARLNWSPVQDAETYSVEIRVWPSGAWNLVAGSPVDTNFILLDNLSPHTTYEWRVRANCSGGLHGFYTNAVQFTTTDLPPCTSPGGLTTNSITETTATLHWSPVSGVLGYKIQIRLPNGIWTDIGGLVSDTTLLVTGLTAHTTYEWHVNAKCNDSQHSNWSSAATFTTTGTGVVNDECASAILLTVETSCVSTFASNVDATASTPPPAGGCGVSGYKDVWFKFTMPDVANPTVTIRTSAGSLGNAVMEVYSGSDCNILSLIACEDNNDNGNGSSMPVINLTGTPNTTIWVRVWGFGGSTGTFTICVFNYILFNYTGLPDTNVPAEGGPIEELEEAVQATMEMDVLPEIHISPNPVSDQLIVVVRQTVESRVIGLRMLDLSGKTMFSQDVVPADVSEYKSRVDISSFVPGIYVLQVQTTGGMMAEKISVIK